MSATVKDVLVCISADPRTSKRAVEGLRMSVGLTLAPNRVRILLEEPATLLLRPREAGLPGAEMVLSYLEALSLAEVEVLTAGDFPSLLASAETVIRWDE